MYHHYVRQRNHLLLLFFLTRCQLSILNSVVSISNCILNLLNQEKVFVKFPSDKENTDICGQSNSSIGDIAHYNLKHFMLKLCACKQEQNFFLRYPPSKLIQ